MAVKNIPKCKCFPFGFCWLCWRVRLFCTLHFFFNDSAALTLLYGWLHTIFTLSHFSCAVLFCSWLGPKKRTRLVLVPLRLSVGDMKEDVTKRTWDRERKFWHWKQYGVIANLRLSMRRWWKLIWFARIPHSPDLWLKLKNSQPTPR